MKQHSLIYKAILLSVALISGSASAGFFIDTEVRKPAGKPILDESKLGLHETKINENDFLKPNNIRVEMPPLRLLDQPITPIEKRYPRLKPNYGILNSETNNKPTNEELDFSEKPALPYGYVSGWADKVPLSVALSQIVPSDWELKVQGVNLNKLVSWTSDGEKWKEVLLTLVEKNELSVVFEDLEKRLHLKSEETLTKKEQQNQSLAQKALNKNELNKNEKEHLEDFSTEPSLEIKADYTKVKTKPFKITEEPKVWHLDSEMTLRENVKRWAEIAGWNPPIWDAVDYPVYGDVTFTGEFTAADGPLATLIEAYKNSKQPLKIKLTTKDRVISVSNKNYAPVNIGSSSARELAVEAFR